MVLELGGKEISPETKKILHELLETCSKIAYDLLSENWEFVENLADQLESKEDLNWDDISPILKDLKTNNKPLIESLNGVKISL